MSELEELDYSKDGLLLVTLSDVSSNLGGSHPFQSQVMIEDDFSHQSMPPTALFLRTIFLSRRSYFVFHLKIVSN